MVLAVARTQPCSRAALACPGCDKRWGRPAYTATKQQAIHRTCTLVHVVSRTPYQGLAFLEYLLSAFSEMHLILIITKHTWHMWLTSLLQPGGHNHLHRASWYMTRFIMPSRTCTEEGGPRTACGSGATATEHAFTAPQALTESI
eukprot:365707-Chlamydomonas_euryale.AAC.39